MVARNARGSRTRLHDDCESFDPGFATPRATRYLLTPTKSGTRRTKTGKIAHWIYRPLELDNESSSESTDAQMSNKRFKKDESTSCEITKSPPLAIEAPLAEVTLTIMKSNELAHPSEGPTIKPIGDDSDDIQIVKEVKNGQIVMAAEEKTPEKNATSTSKTMKVVTTPASNQITPIAYQSTRMSIGTTTSTPETKRLRSKTSLSGFSTPKASNCLLTPTSGSNRSKQRGKIVACLRYKPLELDNESSFDSTDSFMQCGKRRKELIES